MKKYLSWKLTVQIILVCFSAISFFISNGVASAFYAGMGSSFTFKFYVTCDARSIGYPLEGSEVVLFRRDGDFFGIGGTLNPVEKYKVTTGQNGGGEIPFVLLKNNFKAGVYFWGVRYNGTLLTKAGEFRGAMDGHPDGNFGEWANSLQINDDARNAYYFNYDCPAGSPYGPSSTTASTSAPEINNYSDGSHVVDGEVTVTGTNLEQIKSVDLWYDTWDVFNQRGEVLEIKEPRSYDKLTFILQDPRGKFTEAKEYTQTIVFKYADGSAYLKHEYKIRPKGSNTAGNYTTPSITEYPGDAIRVGTDVMVKGYNLDAVYQVEIWYDWGDAFRQSGEKLDIKEQSGNVIVFHLSDPRDELNVGTKRTIVFKHGGGATDLKHEFDIEPEAYGPQKPTATSTPDPNRQNVSNKSIPDQDTETYAQIYGHHEGDFKLELNQKEISVGARVSTRGNTGSCDVIDSVDLSFQKIGLYREGDMDPVDLPVSHVEVGQTEPNGDVYQNCRSYWVALRGSSLGVYRLTAHYVPHNTSSDPVNYKESTDVAIVKVADYNGNTSIPTQSTMKVGGQKGVKTEAKISRSGNFEQRIRWADLLAVKNKNSQVAGVEAINEGGKYTVVDNPNSSSNSIPLVPCVSTDGVNCDTDNIPTLHATINKIENDGTVVTLLDDANYENGKTFDVEIDMNNDNQIQATATYTQDPSSDFSASQGETIVYVSNTQVQAQTYVNLSSNPEENSISSLDNPIIEAATNKVVDNPVFEVTKDGETSSVDATSSSLGCQDGSGNCIYVLNLTQPVGDYKITFKNGDASDSISFNTSSNSQNSGSTDTTNATSAVDITRVVVSVDGGGEQELPLDNSLIDIDLGSLPARLKRIVYFSDNTTKEETFYINSDTNSSGGAASATQACTDTASHPSYPQCAGTTGLEDSEKYITGHMYTVQPLCDNDGQGGVVAYDASEDLGESADCPNSNTSSSETPTEAPTPEPQSATSSNPYWYCLGNTIMQVNPSGDEFDYEKCAAGYKCQGKNTDGYKLDAECVSTGEQNTSSGQTSEYTATGNIYWVCSSDNTYIVEVDPGGNGNPLEDKNGTCQDQGKTCQPKTTEGYYSDAECI